MNNKLLILVLLAILPWKVHGLRNNCMAQSIDSVHVTFGSLGAEPLEIHLISDKYTLSLYKTEYPPLRHSENVLIYQTHSYDTIDYLFSRIKLILDIPPIFDTTVIIYDCCHGMDFTIFENGEVCKQSYTHYPTTYFPFAYAELYSLIRQLIVKYWRRE